MSSINIDSSNLPYGSYTLSIYAIDKVGNIIPPVNRRLSVGFFGINHNNRILTTKKYPNNYPTAQPPSVPFPNQPSSISTILQDIKSMDLNAVRINMYWEGYRWYKSQGKASTFINRLREIASTADSLGLGIVYSVMHQWKISSVLYASSSKTNRGAGFPEECLYALNLIPSNFSTGNSYIYDQAIDGSTNQAMTPRSIFWKSFVTNYNVTINGITKPIWQHIWDDYFKDVVLATKDYNSTVGYELMNEPFEGVYDVNTNDYQGLGNYYSYIAQKIRELTNKPILFTSPLSWRLDHTQIESVYPDLAGKSWQYKEAELTKRLLLPKYQDGRVINKIIFNYNVYGWAKPNNSPYPNGYIHPNDLALFDQFDRIRGELRQQQNVTIPMMITEWNQVAGISTEPTVDTYANGYLAHFKQRGYSWFYFNYDPNHPWTIKNWNYNDKTNSQGITYKKILMDAMRNTGLLNY
jgi:hypothetical protein